MQDRRLFLGVSLGFGLAAATPACADPARAFTSTRITVETTGRGPDVVLIPGLGATSSVWRGTADRLSGRHRVHLISVRGFGGLSAGDNAEGALIAPVAAEIGRYVRETNLTRPALAGHSMGGQIALKVAADNSTRVDRVMTVDAAPFFPALVRPGATVGDIEPIARLAFQAVQWLDDRTLAEQGRRLGLELGGATQGLFDAVGWQGGDRRVLAQGLYEVMTIDLRHRLPDIAMPVSVVYGWSADRASPRNRTDSLFRSAFAALDPAPRFERIEGAEHMVMIDQPTRFMAAMDRFLA